MEKHEFFTYLSQKPGSEAAKEISLKIKASFRQKINFILILFTPGYYPKELFKTFDLVFRKPNLLGIKSPFLIYEGKIIKNGVVGCCISKKGSRLSSFLIDSPTPENIENELRRHSQEMKGRNTQFISFLSAGVNPLSFLEGLRLSLGKLINFSGAGFKNNYSGPKPFFVNKSINEGLLSLSISGVTISNFRLHGFIPLGKPFDITKINPEKQIITEINNKPAVEIYRNYLEEKFDKFIRNRLFSFYPLGINEGGGFRLLNITDILDDGSLLFTGNLKQKTRANLMSLNKEYSRQLLMNRMDKTDDNSPGIIFIIYSLSRRRNLQKASDEEIENIREAFPPEKKIIGMGSDYYLFPGGRNQNANIETGGFLINAWN